MEIHSSSFVISNTDWNKCPTENRLEYAFIGRSNVGKSSLINMLTNNKKLAKTSGKPGKTQLINHFLIDNHWFLVDLPGYGYAQVSKSLRRSFGKIITEYITNRKNLVNLFVLIDSRHDAQKIDLEFMRWLGEKGIPFSIVFTKSDKLKLGQLNANIMKYKNTLTQEWDVLPEIFITSAESKKGKEEISEFIEKYNTEYQEHFVGKAK
ncbi:MAG: YihA family ribosome biogenesis GTP-binding protein [Ichthyobacteriaceae bacterium]|nr:YihA family ribosome biogenesis GTP-binding protein [Ichthyobacteriaceae bacterium]